MYRVAGDEHLFQATPRDTQDFADRRDVINFCCMYPNHLSLCQHKTSYFVAEHNITAAVVMVYF